MNERFLRTPYNYDMSAAGDESALHCTDESMAKQSFAEECDINTIVRRFGITGELPTNIRMPTYGDFTGVHDFKTAMDAIATANESFDALPAEVRARFNNDPAAFVDFCSDTRNRDEAKKLGLISADEVKAAAALTMGNKPTEPSAPTPPKPADSLLVT